MKTKHTLQALALAALFIAKNPLFAFDRILPDAEQQVSGDLSPALCNAAENGDLEEVKRLIADRADVNSTNQDGCTALILASKKFHEDIVKYLSQIPGIDANKKNKHGWTALLKVLSFIDLYKNPMYLTQQQQIEVRTRIIRDLLAIPEMSVNQGTQHGDTALHIATYHSELESMKLLIEHQADVNQAKKDGSTPLHVAVSCWSTDPMRILIEHGANVNQSTNDGSTPLHVAVSHKRSMPLLIEHQADVNKQDQKGLTALHLATYKSIEERTLYLRHVQLYELNHVENEQRILSMGPLGSAYIEPMNILLGSERIEVDEELQLKIIDAVLPKIDGFPEELEHFRKILRVAHQKGHQTLTDALLIKIWEKAEKTSQRR